MSTFNASSVVWIKGIVKLLLHKMSKKTNRNNMAEINELYEIY